MRVTVERDVLDAALGRVGAVVEARNTIPIIGHVLLQAKGDGLRLVATDLDIEVAESVAAQVETPGALTVSASILTNWVRGLPSGADIEMTFDAADPRLKLKAGRGRSTLPILPAGDFPTIGEHALTWGGPIDRALLLRLAGQVAHAMSTEETRYYLNGLYLCTPTIEGRPVLRLVATDGARLACADAPLPEGFAASPEGGIIVPTKTVKTMLRLLDGAKDCELTASASRVRLAAGAAVLSSKVIDGAFPDYERVIPQQGGARESIPVRFDPTLFLGAAKRVGAFSDGKVRTVKLLVEDGQAALSARGQDSGAEGGETFEAAHEAGSRIEVGFNAKFLLDLLPLIGARASFSFEAPSGASGPVLITDETLPGVRHVLMPLRG